MPDHRHQHDMILFHRDHDGLVTHKERIKPRTTRGPCLRNRPARAKTRVADVPVIACKRNADSHRLTSVAA